MDAPTSLGSTFLGAPFSSAPEDVQAAASNPVQFASASEATWVVVHVSGDVGMSRNPECDINDAQAPNWACMNGSVVMPFSSDPWHGGPVLVTAQEGPFTRDVRLRGVGGASTGSAIGLHLTTNAGTLSARLNLAAKWAWNPFTGIGPFSFFLSGGYSVTATAVPSPLALTEGPADEDGARTYTVAAIDGLQFRNPIVPEGWNFPPGTITWHFFPGDSVSTVPGWEGQSREISNCNFQPVCSYSPPGPGRVQVSAYIEGHNALARVGDGEPPMCPEFASISAGGGPSLSFSVSAVTCEPPARPKLTCVGDLGENRVTRGMGLTCTVTKEPADAAGDIRISGWRFENRPRTDGTLTAETWSGAMAIAGEVSVQAAIGDGPVRTLSRSIRVEKRTWPVLQYTHAPTVHVHVVPNFMAEYPPAGLAFGGYEGTFPDFTAVVGQEITSGPNNGAWFIATPLTLPVPRVHLHPALYPPTPQTPPLGAFWYNDQNGHGSGTCIAADVARFAAEVERHEGIGMANNSHFAVGNRVLASRKMHERFERIVSWVNLDDLQVRASHEWLAFRAPNGPWRTAQKAFDDVDRPKIFNNLGCTLDYNPNPSDG